MVPTTTEISAWANTRDAQGLMPILLRRLIHGSTLSIRAINFPGGDSVQMAGFDGDLDVERGNAWVPDGMSIWEFGCNKQVKRKADADYEKRTIELDTEERGKRAFVFVTPRRWSKKSKWTKSRRAEGAWKDVRCFDADDLEQWLERTPPAAIWLAEQIGLPSAGFVTAHRIWDLWAKACDPVLPLELVLAGREDQAKSLIEALGSKPGRPITISADSREEALAFVCATLSGTEENTFSDRLLIAEASSPIERLQGSTNVVLAIVSAALEQRVGSLGDQFHILIPRARGETSEEAQIPLGSIRGDAFDECLKELGLSEDGREAAARESGRSLTVLRRRWAKSPGLRQPSWSGDSDTARKLVPFALCGTWNTQHEGDLSVLAGLANRDRHLIEQNISDLLMLDDAPIEVIGPVNRVVSQIDALFAVGMRITRTDLDRFFDIVESTFGVRDPALDLPEEKRWMANILGKQHPYSGGLLRGLGNTLILLSIHGDAICGQRLGTSVSGRVHGLVRTLLSDLTGEQWLSIRGNLQLLAEADPDAFLTAIERDLAKPDPGLIALMPVIEGGVTGTCLRTELLWALELSAWDPRNLVRVAEILARLSRHPISDNWGNKPSNSLLSLFRAWLPKTASPIERRAEALRRIFRKYPDVAFDLCVRLVDSRHDIATDNARPRWRDDATGAGRGVTQGEYAQVVFAAADLLTAEVPQRTDHLEELIRHLPAFPPEYKNKIWGLVESWIGSGPDDEDKAALRETIRRHALLKRGRKNAKRGDAERAQAAYDQLEPTELVAKHRWLFDNHWVEWSSTELDGKLDHEARERAIEKARADAMQEVWGSAGLEGVIDFANAMKSPNLVGYILVSHSPRDFDAKLAVAGALARPQQERANAFLRGLLGTLSTPDLSGLLKTYSSEFQDGEVNREHLLRVLYSAPVEQAVWDVLAKLEPDLVEEYWRTVPIGWGRWSSEQLEFLVQSLLDARRPRTAFHAADLDWGKLASGTVVKILEATATGEEANIALPRSYDLERAFERLDEDPEVDRTRVARLEFSLAPALVHGERGPAALHEQLSKDPTLFVQMIAYVYRRSDGGSDPPEWKIEDSESAANVGTLCWEILHHWRQLPGQRPDGSIDGDAFKAWVAESRKLCAEHGRSGPGDSEIGQLLAHAPSEADGTWPCLPVRELLEEFDTERLTDGVRISVYNKRGVTSRGLFEGGQKERELAELYDTYAKEVETKWPRTAGMLRDIADHHRRDGEWHDSDARLNALRDL